MRIASNPHSLCGTRAALLYSLTLNQVQIPLDPEISTVNLPLEAALLVMLQDRKFHLPVPLPVTLSGARCLQVCWSFCPSPGLEYRATYTWIVDLIANIQQGTVYKKCIQPWDIQLLHFMNIYEKKLIF